MDIDLLRTFLEVRRLGNFRAAADNLHVTQAAVSQRIKQLESVMNARLFIREKNNIYVTQAGEQLVGAAETILSTWQHAKSSIGDGTDAGPGMSLAAPAGIWSLRGHRLLAQLAGLRADLTFIAETQNEVPLTLQARGNYRMGDVTARDFVSVDWGRPVRLQLAAALELHGTPRLSASDHLIAENFVSEHGGFALLPEPPRRGLTTIDASPRLQCTVYALWHRRNPLHALIAGLFDEVLAPGPSPAAPVN